MKRYVNFVSDDASIARHVEGDRIKLQLGLPFVVGHTMMRVRVVSCVVRTGWAYNTARVSLRAYTPCNNATSLDGPPVLATTYTMCSARTILVPVPEEDDAVVPQHHGTCSGSAVLEFTGVLRELELMVWTHMPLDLGFLSVAETNSGYMYLDFTLECETF